VFLKIPHLLLKENRNMATTIAVVEDNPEFMRRFVGIVEADSDFTLAGVAATGSAAIELIGRSAADLYLVDLGLPDMSGIDVIRLVADTYPDSEVMVISVFGDEQHVIESIEAGATGYLLKDSSAQQIAASIRTLLDGGSVVSPVIARKVLQRFQPPKQPASAPPAPPAAARAAASLSERELQILRDLAKGSSYQEIGATHYISPHTVARHVKSIYRKLTVHSRGEAVHEASRRGLIAL
jgi:DNA-binding NarL/FixJ family response regulator